MSMLCLREKERERESPLYLFNTHLRIDGVLRHCGIPLVLYLGRVYSAHAHTCLSLSLSLSP